MQAAEIKLQLEETPFEPFTIHMANGGFAQLDLRLATHTEPERKKSKGRKR